VTTVEAENTGREAHKASHEDAENLYQTVFLAIGARVCLTQNVWVEQGLINGSMGVIHDIDWPAGTDPRKAMPRAVLVKFDHYTGPALFTDPEDGRPVVPILPVRREFEYQGVQCSRRQLPIALAYAITVHKAQGLTLERAVINLSLPEFVTGQVYVAISRVKTLRGLLFETGFDFDYFAPKTSLVRTMRFADMQRRRHQLLQPL